MTDSRAAAVEAAARAICAGRGDACGERPCDYFGGNRAAQCRYPTVFAHEAEDAIAAYLARMAEAGWVMVRDCGEMTPDYEGYVDERFADGWNACRAAMHGRDDHTREEG